MTFGDHVLAFYRNLDIRATLPKGVEVLNPYQHDGAMKYFTLFLKKFYGGNSRRIMILGINPGRFGGGITGIPFTDPIKLQDFCGIPNDLKKKAELSADFIYAMIDAFGGPEKFYKKFYISALSPLGFTKEEKNLNYYDIPALQQALEPFMIQCIERQLAFGVRRDICFCLGEGKNFAYLQDLNERQQFFDQIIPLAHPRFIMQYKRKMLDRYIANYIEQLTKA